MRHPYGNITPRESGQTSTGSFVTRNLMGTQKEEFVDKGAASVAAGANLREPVDWHSINWKKAHRNVRRLQARIVKAMKKAASGETGVCRGLSRVPGNWPARFLGEGAAATPLPYPTSRPAPSGLQSSPRLRR